MRKQLLKQLEGPCARSQMPPLGLPAVPCLRSAACPAIARFGAAASPSCLTQNHQFGGAGNILTQMDPGNFLARLQTFSAPFFPGIIVSRKPPETRVEHRSGFWKERRLKRMGHQPLEGWVHLRKPPRMHRRVSKCNKIPWDP